MRDWVYQRLTESGCSWDHGRPVLTVLPNDEYAEVSLRLVVDMLETDEYYEVFVRHTNN